MINIEPEDMAQALRENPLAMEQAKVATLLRENAVLKAELDQLRSRLTEAKLESGDNS